MLWCFVRFAHRLDSKSAGGRSIASNLMKDDEVDDDSITAYNEGETGKSSHNHHKKILIALKMHVFILFLLFFVCFSLK